MDRRKFNGKNMKRQPVPIDRKDKNTLKRYANLNRDLIINHLVSEIGSCELAAEVLEITESAVFRKCTGERPISDKEMVKLIDAAYPQEKANENKTNERNAS